MSTVFADTYFFLGIINRADDAHARCQTFSWDYRGEILTTAYILVELADALASPPHRMAAAAYIRLGWPNISGWVSSSLQADKHFRCGLVTVLAARDTRQVAWLRQSAG